MSRANLSFFCLFGVFAALFPAARVFAADETMQAVISVADQRMVVLKDGGMIARYPVSTSKFGVGDGSGSYRTPLGRLRVCDKVGDGFQSGSVIRHRQPTGEVLPVNAPGRDPIVTRILWLDGCESQNSNARDRSIYIHGTTEEKNIGKPVSWGCIRMRSQDVIALYQDLPVGAGVTIISERLPRYPKYAPKPEPAPVPEVLVASAKKTSPPPPIASREPAPAQHVAAATAGASATHKTITVEPTTRHASTGNSNNSSSSEMVRAMNTSILLSGLGDGNSEIPQLRQ